MGYSLHFFMVSSIQIGHQGEDIAVEYLRAQGYLIAARNWRNGRYEIDIVAERLGVTHLIEVKTRRAGSLQTPESTITRSKVSALHRAAAAYLAQCRVGGEVEFDLLAIDMFADGSYDVRFIRNIAEFNW